MSPAARRAAVRAGTTVASAAALIAVVTVVARVVGFVRQLVFVRAVDVSCLNSAYTTANSIPNILFEIVAGGALAAVVVPVLAGGVARGDREQVRRTTSALLGWTLLVLLPLGLVTAALARPLVEALMGEGGACGDELPLMIEVATRMLVVFSIQIPLYGVCVVLTGILQAHHRFLSPALAPLLSSLVVMSAYVAYAASAGDDSGSLSALTREQELILSVGTTLGVLAMALTQLPVAARLGLDWKPTLRFPPGVAIRVRALAAAALATVVAQQLATAVVIRLANDNGSVGAVGLYTLTWTVFLVPWAVLAVPLATSAFPRLVAHHEHAEREEAASLAAGVGRAVVVVSALAAAALVASAEPLSRFLVLGHAESSDVDALAAGLVAFAPALVGYGLVAHLTRVLYATGAGRTATVAVVVGWVVVVLVDVPLVRAWDADRTVAALGVGTTVGMSLAGLLLILGVRRLSGPAAVHHVGRSVVVTLVAGVLAAAAGRGLLALTGPGSTAATGLLVTVLVSAVTLVVGVAVLAVVARDDVARAVGPVLRRTRRRTVAAEEDA